MASIISSSPSSFATLPSSSSSRVKCTTTTARAIFPVNGGRGLGFMPTIQISKATGRSAIVQRRAISCSIAAPETLKVVASTIAKQLSVDESTVSPQTKFADLGADSLDTVEIMMALEEKFGVSIGEEGAANLSTVQDAADLIEKVKAEEAA